MTLPSCPMPSPKPNVSDTEMDVLRLLWDAGPCTVRELMERLNHGKRDWAYTTVQTLVNRLRDKGMADRKQDGVAHRYRAAVTRERFLGWRLKEVAEQVCDGSPSPLVMNLVQGGKLTADELSDLRSILDEAETKPARKRRKGSRGS